MKIPYPAVLRRYGGTILLTITGAAVGFLAASLIFGKPWRLRPNWGDIPTWLAFAAAAIGGAGVLLQLAEQQRQIAAAASRNERRDKLLDTQLAEAQERVRAYARRQAELVRFRGFPGRPGKGGWCEVANGSTRPIRWVQCKELGPGPEVAPSEYRIGVRSSSASIDDSHADVMNYMPADPREVDQQQGIYRNLLAGQVIRVGFPARRPGALPRYAVRFLDDAVAKWQLNDDMHLEPMPPPAPPTLPGASPGHTV